MTTNIYNIELKKAIAQLEKAFKQKEEDLTHPIILDLAEVEKTTTTCKWWRTDTYVLNDGWVINRKIEQFPNNQPDITYELICNDNVVVNDEYHVVIEFEEKRTENFGYFKLNDNDIVHEIPAQLLCLLRDPEIVAKELRLVTDED